MKLSAEELAQALEIADMWIKNDAPHSAVPLSKAFRRLEAEYREARQEAARYREALEFYANPQSYVLTEREGTAYQMDIDADIGTRAREALKPEGREP